MKLSLDQKEARGIFATRLKLQRRIRNLTQAELGEILDVSQISVCHWEQGRFFPQIDTLMTMADEFGCSVDHLLGRTSDD